MKIRNHILPLIKKQQQHYECYLKKSLKQSNVHILDYLELNSRQKKWVDDYFKQAIFPVLTPLAVDPAHPFPFVSNLSLNLAAIVIDSDSGAKQFARIKIPQGSINRFISIPQNLSNNELHPDYVMVPIEQIVAYNLHMLFPGMEIESHSFFRVTLTSHSKRYFT